MQSTLPRVEATGAPQPPLGVSPWPIASVRPHVPPPQVFAREAQFQLNQPWVKGFNGEFSLGDMQYQTILARLWIDQDLKQEMGF